MATGMWQPNEPRVEGSEYFEGYETVSINPDDFEGQTVLILGLFYYYSLPKHSSSQLISLLICTELLITKRKRLCAGAHVR